MCTIYQAEVIYFIKHYIAIGLYHIGYIQLTLQNHQSIPPTGYNIKRIRYKIIHEISSLLALPMEESSLYITLLKLDLAFEAHQALSPD
jgi:hypothetical protein